jgi:type II secretory pathway pseudopilin PulG
MERTKDISITETRVAHSEPRRRRNPQHREPKLLEKIRTLALLGFAAVAGAALSGNVTAAAALATALVSVFAVLLQQEHQKRLDLQQAHREQMIPFYEGFIDKVGSYAEKIAEGEPPNESLTAFMGEMHTKLLLRAPTTIIDAWVVNTRVPVPDDPTDPTAVLAYERLLRAMRADLGHDDSKMPEGDLLRIFVTNIDDHLPPRKASKK